MIGRREFIAGATTALATPFILTKARAATPRVRRDVQSLAPNDPFFAKYGEAIKKMHDLPSSDPRNWRNQALIHINHCPHGTQSFVHWHRHYLHNYELICGQLIGDPDFSLAYWNWAAKRGTIPDPFYDLGTLNVQVLNDPSNAQSNNWGPATVVTVGNRALTKGKGLQDDVNAGVDFTQDFIDGFQQQPDFQFFTSQMERFPHNAGHTVTGGTRAGANGHMRDGMSPLDPIFWLHHCNIDRLWAEWETAGNSTPPFNLNYNNQFVDGAGNPVNASSASALDFAAMNYTYDTLVGPLVTQQIQQLGLQAIQGAAAPPQAPVAPQVLGADAAAKKVVPQVETRFTIAPKELLPNLFKQRTFRANRVPTVRRAAVGSGKIFAKLSDVTAPETDNALICKVFVSCPYLAPETPSTDPLCAGSFSFFGSHGSSHGHDDIYVDITRPLHALSNNGMINPEAVSIQIMAVPYGGGATDSSFQIGKVELFSL